MPRRRVVRRRRWPLLRKIDPNKMPPRRETPEVIRKLLSPMTSLDIGDQDTSESDISDAFEEVHGESFLNAKKTGRKDMTKHEADTLTMGQFSDLFKSTMKAVREEMKIGDNMFLETYNDIIKIIEMPKERKDPPKETMDSIAQTLSDPGPVVPMEMPKEMSEMSYDYMSGVWNMLEAECKGNKFTVSPMNFNVYSQQEPHWLQRPEVPQESLEGSKTKCHKWLTEQHS